ncbi:TolC family protein [uncultured Formosa sp.]|uniref:TolC family protein n=1 Tax=uncultured Formosa sp. TaxID=255435 RepID=UPI0026206CF3|nr:TolC family protein [uncultured Formosa sp.]
MKRYQKNMLQSFLLMFCAVIRFNVQAQDLEQLIRVGLQQNTNVEQADLQYKLATEKVNEVQVIPNTEFSFGYFATPLETRTGNQKIKASVVQKLPWFGSITARENYASSLADAQYESIAIAQRKLVMSISQNYYELWANTLKQDVLEEQITILKQYEVLALTSLEVGKASVVDVLKLQMRGNEISERIALLKQDYLAVQTQINLDLNRDKSQVILVTSNLEMPEEEVLELDEITNLHPELLQYDKLYESVEQSDLLNQKERAPTLGFGLDYIAIEERRDLDVVHSGNDVFVPMVSVSIPIFNSKYKSKSVQNTIQKETYKVQKQDKKNNLMAVLDTAIKQRNSALIRFKTQIKNLEQAKNAQDILLKSYETGMIDFDDVLDIEDLQLKYEISRIESIKLYYKQQTIINYLTQ